MSTQTGFDTVKTIIDFAIQKEQEAVDFYTGLAGRVKLKSVADEFLKFANMERGHKEKLQKMDPETTCPPAAPQVMDLKIADYLVEKQPDESMGWQDVVHIAMQRELASMNLYKNLASKVTDPCAKSLLENLAADEAEHKLFFERIWDEDILAEN